MSVETYLLSYKQFKFVLNRNEIEDRMVEDRKITLS